LRAEWNKTGSIHVGFFYLRRSLRIWPIYFLFVGVAAWLNYQLQEISPDTASLRLLGLLTFTDNIMSARYSYYNPIWSIPHLWTISYEEQFYAVIPWLLRLIFSRTKGQQLGILGVIFGAGSAIRAIFIALAVPAPAIWVLPITHFESILFGLAIGLGLFDVLPKKIPSLVTAATGLTALFLCTRLPNADVIGWWLMATYPLVGMGVSMLIYSTLREPSGFMTKFLRLPAMAFLGKISYGLYLFHYMAIDLAARWVGSVFGGKSIEKQSYLIFVIALTSTIIISSASYLWIEKPFLKLKSRFSMVESRPA
jgi:peptidoglycan/LPS O-acetylase OafA/YrhL